MYRAIRYGEFAADKYKDDEVEQDFTFYYWKEVAKLGEFDIFGELALINDTPRKATIECVEPVEVLYLEREDFQ